MRFFGLKGQRQIPRNLKHGACLQKQHDVFIIHFILLHEGEKNWENVDAKKMLKYSLLLKHYLLMNETWMTDFSWQTCLACQVLNVGYEKCKML